MRNRKVLSGHGRQLDKAIWHPNRSNTISGFASVELELLPSEGQSLWANQISSTYLNWWLRYNYFRFCKTNVRHIGNLHSVSISTICQKSAHYSASGYRTLSKSKHPLRKYEYYFRFRICWCHCLQKVKSISKPNFVDISQMEVDIYFYDNPKWLGKGSIFSKSRMCQYPMMLCYILWIQKCIFDACRLSLHNSTPSHCTIMGEENASTEKASTNVQRWKMQVQKMKLVL